MEQNKDFIDSQIQSIQTDQSNDTFKTSIIKIFKDIISIRKTLYKAAIIGFVIGLIIAFSLPSQYTVTVTLSPEMNNDKSTNGLANLASTFLGNNALSNGGSDALNIALSSDIVSSTPFIIDLFKIQVQNMDGDIDTTLVAYLDKQKTPWWNSMMQIPGKAIGKIKQLFVTTNISASSELDPFQLTPIETAKIDFLRNAILADINKRTGITTISVTLQDPKVSAIVADSVINKLQQYIIKYRIAKAKEDCEYLTQLYNERKTEYYEAQEKYAQYMDTNKNVILQSVRTEQERLLNDMNLAYQVYSQIAQQLEMARAKIQEAKPVFAIVEPATIPLFPSSMNKKTIIVTVILLSLLITAFWGLRGKSLYKQLKEIFIQIK